MNCNMATGGETRRLDVRRDVHPDNLKLFVDATRELGLRLAGIDFITPDMSRSHKDIRCAINEINRAPMLDAHYFADFAQNNLVGERILSVLQRSRR
jgi:cyanophycin synthetase